jgi:predicted component of type VI protein secretion system
MPFRLRYKQHNLELAPGEVLIGRDADCQIVLDDPLVSRKHAKLMVGQDSVKVCDLGSRNGVTVNGARIGEPRLLAHADRVGIGSQEMMIVAYLPRVADESQGPAGRRIGAETLTAIPAVALAAATPVPIVGDTKAAPNEPGERNENSSSAASPKRAPASWKQTAGRPAPDCADRDALAGAGSVPVLSGLADKALGLGRTEEAERIIGGLTADVLKSLEQGEVVSDESLDLAAQYAARLASATGKGKWVDYLVGVYSHVERPFPALVIDELHGAIRKIDAVDVGALRAYVALLHEKAGAHGPAERFLVQRIEGLERLAALR